MSKIENIVAREILDSRGIPTIEVEVMLLDGTIGRAASPSGTSESNSAAMELRDGDHNRYGGNGVLRAVEIVGKKILPLLKGEDVTDQKNIDTKLIATDGTKNKSIFGGNTMTAVSLACARVAAKYKGIPLYRHIVDSDYYKMPNLMMNLINCGAHADSLVAIQEFMVMPVKTKTVTNAIRVGAEILHSLKVLLKSKGHSTNVGYEGGFTPNVSMAEDNLEFLMAAVSKAGYKVGNDIMFALDCAANEFYINGKYQINQKSMSYEQLSLYYKELQSKFPIISIEDPMAEWDKAGWAHMRQVFDKDILIVGDDLFATNKALIDEGAKKNYANAVIIKPNQIGTLTETLEAVEVAKRNGFKTIVSHRSGDTDDSFIAHLAVACSSDFIKTGAPCRAERTAKYNELIRIEELLVV